jgi:hypothetical protein
MREYTKALEAAQEATAHDADGKHAREVQEQTYKIQAAISAERQGESDEQTLERAMRDPEIAVRAHPFTFFLQCIPITRCC